MMRKTMLLILLFCFVGWMTWFWYPAWERHTDLVNAIFSERTDPSRALVSPNGILTPAAWILLILLVLVGITLYGLNATSSTHGSARHANRDDLRSYRVSHLHIKRDLLRLVGKFPLIRRAIATHCPGWLAPQKEEQRLLLGDYGFSTISLSQRLQQQNVLLGPGRCSD